MIELTPTNAADYLLANGFVESLPLRVEALGWGVSNAVLRVTMPDRVFIVKQSRPQLRTKEAWFSRIDRVFREVEVMALLHSFLSPTVPQVLFLDRDNYLFGMSHAPLEATVWKEDLLVGMADPQVARNAGTVLGRIHETTARQPSLVKQFGDRTVFVELRVDPFYVRVKERRPEVVRHLAGLIERMMSANIALCHGDFTPKNILVHPRSAGQFTLVDYETAHFGDPTMDIGLFLAHLVLKSIRQRLRFSDYFQLTIAFWNGYKSVVQFRPLSESMPFGIQHFAACLLARIDGTSPVDYLPNETEKEGVRRIARTVLHETPREWADVLAIAESEITILENGTNR